MKREEASQAVAQDFEEVREALSRMIVGNPLTALGVAAGLGYVLGGGLRSRLGRALILFAAKQVGQDLLANLMVTTIHGLGRRNIKTSARTRPRGDGSSGQSVRGQSAGRSGRRQTAT